MTINEATLSQTWNSRKEKFASRDQTGRRMREVLSNRFDASFKDVSPPGQEPLVANLLAAGARTMARRVAKRPRIEAEPRRSYIDENVTRAIKHQTRLRDYAKRMRLRMSLLQAAYWLVAHDLVALVVRQADNGYPVIEVKDPLGAYPSNIWPHMPDTADVLFTNKLPVFQAEAIYPEIRKIIAKSRENESLADVTIGEWFDDSGLTVALLEPRVVILETKKNARCFLGRGFSPDLDFHGQFDNVLPMLLSQARMNTLMFDFMDRQVYSEDWIVGADPEIVSNSGAVARGPGAVNMVRNGDVKKIQNNMSQQFAPELDRIERYIRVGGEFPTQLSGEPQGQWTTGKGQESLMTQVDDSVEYWQEVMGDALTRAFTYIPSIAKNIEAPNFQDFSTPDDVEVSVSFHSLNAPTDVVQELQLAGAGIRSKEGIAREYSRISDVQEEMAEIEMEQLRNTLLQTIAAKVQQGQYGPADIAKIAKARVDKRQPLEKVIEEIDTAKSAAASGGGAPGIADLLGGAQSGTAQGLTTGPGPLPGVQASPQQQPPVNAPV